MSKFDASKSNLMILGTWNPAIVEPNWLKKEFPELISDTLFTMELVLGPTQAVRYDIGKLSLECTNQRLLFIPKNFNDDILVFTSGLAVGIHSKLQHTPIIAAGCNFHYVLDENETFKHESIKDNSIFDEFYKGADLNCVTQSIVRHRLSFEYHTLTLVYSIEGDVKTLQYNFEYKGDNCVERVAESMIQHFNESKTLNEYLIGAGL